ncbi:MAG: M48 family metalloprotease, partial [Xanthobacteraceae bacterium]
MTTRAATILRTSRATLTGRAVALVTAAALASASLPAPARAQGVPTIRDAETEQLLRDYMRPLLRVAGLTQQNIQVVIVNDGSFNAFVVDARRIFVNAGALMQAQTPNEIIGVLAHETGHIAGGHLSRMREQLAHAQTASIIGLLLGVGAMVAASQARGSSGNAGAAILAPQEAIRRSLLSYQ